MDKLKALYDVLTRDGYYTKTFEEFQSQFQDASYQDKVYGVVTRDGLFTKSKEEFLRQYAVGPAKPIIEPLKKKEAPAPISGSEFLSGVGSSGSSGTNEYALKLGAKKEEDFLSSRAPKNVPYQPINFKEPAVPPAPPSRSKIVAPDNTVVVTPNVEEYNLDLKLIDEKNKLKEEQKKIDRAKAQEQEQLTKSLNLAANQDAQFQQYLQEVNAGLIDKTEEEVVPALNKRFNAYGFHFEEALGGNDAMYVRTADGKHELLLPLDPLLTSTEVATSKKLRDFLTQYAQGREEEKSEDYIGKALRAQRIREKGMRNDDGTYSTVKFTSFEQDGKYFVIPTLFPKDPNASYTTNKSDWMELPFEQALAEARKRGEVFEFDTDQEAKNFAEGDWKDINAYDIEGQAFYKEKGLDYYAEKKKYNTYTKYQDELELIDKIINAEVITPQERLDNPEYFSSGGVQLYTKKELEQKRAEVLKKKDSLLEQVYDVEFFGVGDGPVQKTREDFDVVLGKRQNEIAGEAIKINTAAKQEYDALNQTAMELYNVPIDKITTIIPKTPQDVESIKNLTAQLVKVKSAQQDAANKFEIAKTYYDAKWNKATNKEYEENWAGFITSVSDAIDNGQAAEQILLLTLGVKDAESITDRQEAARIITENLMDVSGKQSRVMTRMDLSRDGEFSKAFFSDPWEATLTLAATSLAQMAPYGLKIVASSMAAGAAIGGTAGLIGGPFAPATVTGGVIAGGAKGFQTGMAATAYAMEYTNSIMDVMREKGYDLLDPQQVEAALMDESVWDEGGERGKLRGVPIAVVDYLTAGLAGKVFQTSRLATLPVRVGAQVAERGLIDPASEALGEYTAQVVSGQDINIKEIGYEALGGIGNNTPYMAYNLYKQVRDKSNTALAYELTDINRVARETVSDERISQWANNMHKLGKIDADVNQRIQQNVGLRRDARELVSVGRTSRLLGDGIKVEARVMDLLAARNELSSTTNRKEINRNKISQINQEIAYISETKKLLPESKEEAGDGVNTAVNLDAILGTTREGVSRFTIGGKTMTREQFLKELDKMNNYRLLRTRVNVENDKEVFDLYNKKLKDAIQKQSPSAVPVQSETGVSETVQEGKPEAKPEVTTEQGEVKVPEAEEVAQAQEDLVSSKTRLDEITESIGQRIDYTEQDLANFDTLEEEKANGVITALAEKVAEGATLSDIENNVYNANKKKIDEVSNLVAERTAIEQEVSDLESILQASERKVEFKAEEAPRTIETTASALESVDVNDLIEIGSPLKGQKSEGVPIGNKYYGLSLQEENALYNNNKEYKALYDKDEAGTITEEERARMQDIFKGETKRVASVKISEAYNKAKQDGSNPELVQSVEKLIGKPTKAEFRAEEKISPIDFSTQLEEKYGIQLDLTGNLDKGDITLSRIVVPEDKRNTGVGTKVMEEIIKYADANGVKITLTPSTDFGGQSVKRLTDFYKKFGFVENKGDNKDFKIKDAMYRSPEKKVESKPSNDYQAISNIVLTNKELNTVRASLRASAPDSFALQILDAIAKGESTDTGIDSLNEAIDDAIENGVSIGTIANLILEEDTIVENKRIDSKRKAIDYVLNIGGKGTILKAANRKAEFRAEEAAAETEVAQDEVEAITEQINQIPSGNTLTSLSSNVMQPEVDTTDLNKRVNNPLPTVRIEIVNGIPVIFTISDQLTTGTVVNPETGREITDLYGGIGFNGMNPNAAWAYTLKEKADTALNKAKTVYTENKPTFEEFWKNNPEYNGLVPMMVVKMGEGSILSNEATARVLADNISEFPEVNRVRALGVLSELLIKKIKSLRASAEATTNDTTKKNYTKEADGYQNVLDLIAENNLKKIDELLQYKIFSQIDNLITRANLISLIGYGAPNIPGKKKKTSKPSDKSLVTRAIAGIPAKQDPKDINPNKRYELLNLANVVNAITESTIADIDSRTIVGIVGVDVLNPKVLDTDNGDFTHPNYQYGLNGRTIGILEQPVALVDAYPEAYNLALQKLIDAESKFVKEKKDGKKIIKPGNRLFNQSIKEVTEIADRYYQKFFRGKRPRFYGTRSINKKTSKRIADSFGALVDNPTDPNVRKAYEALVREVIEQYKFFIDAGYVTEINNEEPYGNSREMIEDLRTNKRMKILSTEAGYGNDKITPEQRERNILLRESDFYDINGQRLLVNDLFRVVHDFFGHAELGNSFGPIGEENAWNVHVRMFSKLARQAMTTELRGQNSYANFSGVNERIESMRQQAANLRNQGKLDEAEALVAKIYEEITFAEQKQGILPEEFWTIDVKDEGDAEFKPTSIQSIFNTGIGVQNGLTQTDFVGAVANGDLSNATKLAHFLNNAFPSVTISTDKVSFDNIMSQVGTEMYMRGDQVIYGVTVDGDVYINPDVHNSESALFNTTIHEFGHVWTDYLQTSEKGKKIYARGVQLINEAIANDENVKKIFDAQMKKYPGNRARAINETMAILIGNKGEVIVNAGIKSKFNEWLLGVWRFIKENFKMSKDLTVKEIQNLTLDGFIETALADIFSGKEISLTEAQKKALKNPDAMFSSTQSMHSIIQQARANGFSDAAIKQVLLNRGFKANDINNALKVQIDIETDLPREFANVQGGVSKGYQLFTDVRAQLQRFAHSGPRGGVRKEQTKTWSEIREKAIELLKAHPIYKAQADTVQMELISAFDRTLNTSANTNVTRQISAIRNNLRQRRIGAKELQQAKIAVKNLIRSVLPKSDTYSQIQINKLISIISNATEATILADTEKVMAIVQQQRAKMKTSVLKQMMELVNKKAKAAMTSTGKRRSRGLDPEGQAFFAQVKPILRAIINNDTEFMAKLADELLQADVDGLIDEAINKESLGEKLTVQEQALLNKAYAFDTFGDLMTMELEDVQQLLSELEDARAESIKKLKTRREVRTIRKKALNEQATAQVSELYPELFVEETKEVTLTDEEVAALQVGDKVMIQDTSSPDSPKREVEVIYIYPEDGSIALSDGIMRYLLFTNGTENIFKVSRAKTVIKEKSKGKLTQDRAAIRLAFQNMKLWSGFKQLVARWDFTTITGIKNYIRNRILHVGSLSNLFDNEAKGLTFFRDNIYRPLNRMDEKSKLGYFLEMANLDAMANSIPGITEGYKQIRKMLQTGIHTFTINGQSEIYNADKLLRIYALSLNDVQRGKLKEMGWDDAQIQKIKDIVGPQAIEFANKLVDYLSNDYYESVNNVYSHVNDVNLGYIPNYFPTITEAEKVNAKLLEDGDFNGIFNAETAPALKERTDKSGLVELNYDFTDVVESHFNTMEKYKAYAEGVKDLNTIVNNKAFNLLLEQSGLKEVFKRSLNFAITPNAGQKEKQTIFGKLISKFTGFALAFKLVQIPKQAVSFISAYEDYRYFPKDSRVPKAIQAPIDALMFVVDTAKVIATLPKQIRKSYDMSANVKDRFLKGIEGDVYGLESGSSVFTPISKSNTLYARAIRAYKTGAAAPTVMGDILGVMGYMVNYNRNIANGMTEAEALEAFNDYNATLQSRRGTEKSPIQQNSNELTRAVMMFTSTTLLQINKVLTAQTNMFRALKEGKMPKSKDIRAFVINLGLANALFVATANLSKFIKGDDDDRKEALKEIGRAMLGLNLIESIPLVGAAIETALMDINGEKKRTTESVVNPYLQVYRKMKRISDEGVSWRSVQPVVEISIGAQLDPFIGLYNGFAEGFDEEAIYDILGISKSYRPTQEKEGNDTPKDKPMTKEDMKRYYPEMYEQLYGPYSNSLEADPAYQEYQKLIDEELQRAKDAAHGYTPSEKEK